ncbi:MAG: hypothetical protein O3C57_06555, partial [Verrucomicrobia bacterium]|nr:hypothetical protein [Verrucomicrobiota bacterium]
MTRRNTSIERIAETGGAEMETFSERPNGPQRRRRTTDVPDLSRPKAAGFIERFERVQEDALAVSRVLPGAVNRSVQSGGLGEALVPAVQRALLLMGKRDPRSLADALAPAMGPAIRRSFWGATRDMVLRLNFWLLRYVSTIGLRWRMEAHRSRKTFEEIVIEHTQASPIRQVFLIHRETGLLIQEAQSLSTASPQDWDIISSMLSALQDFIQDSFNMDHDTPLETIKVGRVSVLIEQGPHVAVAGILEGEARPEYKQRIKDACSRIHAESGEALAKFTGDTTPFETCIPHLEACLLNLVNPGRLPLLPQTALVLLLPLLLIAGWVMPGIAESIRWKNYLGKLAEEPGLIVIESGRKDGVRHVTGLRDPLARNPTDMLVQAGFTPSDVLSHWEPFQGLSSSLALARANRLLDPP